MLWDRSTLGKMIAPKPPLPTQRTVARSTLSCGSHKHSGAQQCRAMHLPLHHQQRGTRIKRPKRRAGGVQVGLVALAMGVLLVFASLLYLHSMAALAAVGELDSGGGAAGRVHLDKGHMPTFQPGYVPWLDASGAPIQVRQGATGAAAELHTSPAVPRHHPHNP